MPEKPLNMVTAGNYCSLLTLLDANKNMFVAHLIPLIVIDVNVTIAETAPNFLDHTLNL